MKKPKLITLKQKVACLEQIVKDTFWMARRYAHGRHTYAPCMVRDSYYLLKKYFPELVPDFDVTLDDLFYTEEEYSGRQEDYLNDINENRS